MRRTVAAALGVLVLGTTTSAYADTTATTTAEGNEPVPMLTSLPGGSKDITLVAPSVDTAKGYVGKEYVLSGTATSFEPVGTLGSDGKWKVKRGTTAPYATRVVVYRPADPKRFNGTVFVEWLNVSAGFDSAPDWGLGHTAIARSGAAYVGVSAQAVGVQGGVQAVSIVPSGGLKASNPARYGNLSHPGDQYSYDMFTQAGRAAEGKAKGPKLLGGLKAKRVIALGESQSASRMTTYINAVDPVSRFYDGFLVHSRGAGASSLGVAPPRGTPDTTMPSVVQMRPPRVPVLTFSTETDLERLGNVPVRPTDTKKSRLWEVAGTAHADSYTQERGFGDDDSGKTEAIVLDPKNSNGGPLGCSSDVNAGPQWLVLGSALTALDRWVTTGTTPAKAPRLQLASTDPAQIARDANGNAVGGIRTPFVDAPLASITGAVNPGGSFCALFGITTPYDAAKVASLYPTRAAYLEQFDRSLAKAVAAGYIQPKDAKQLRAAARQIQLPVPQG